MRWHLERARIIASIESEMTTERRHSTKLSYVNIVNDKLYLQVCGRGWGGACCVTIARVPPLNASK